MTLKERFLKKVLVSGKHWLWTGAVIKDTGYGKIWDFKLKKDTTAHRLAYRLFVGPIPEGSFVLHKHEGMKLCVNPDCLKLGDGKDNAKDFLTSGRTYGRKLTRDQIMEIRTTVWGPVSPKDLALKFGVSVNAIRYARQGRTWRNLPIEKAEGGASVAIVVKPKPPSDEDLKLALSWFNGEVTAVQVANRTGKVASNAYGWCAKIVRQGVAVKKIKIVKEEACDL